MDEFKEKFELSDGMKGVIAFIIGLFAWLIFFVLGKILLGLVFVEVGTALLIGSPIVTIWGIIITVGIAFAVGIYIDKEL